MGRQGMKLLLKVLCWFGGVTLALIGLGFAFASIWAGALSVIAALMLLPPAREYAYSLTKLSLTTKQRALSVFGLVFASLVLIGIYGNQVTKAQEEALAEQAKTQQEEERKQNAQEFATNRTVILAQVDRHLTDSNPEAAIKLLSTYSTVDDDGLKQALKKANDQIQLNQNKAREKELLDQAAKTNNPNELHTIYSELSKLLPLEANYVEKRGRYEAAIEEAKKQDEEAEAAVAKALDRQKSIKSQFSSWDGSHRNLERLIKKSMNDPDSYEHDSTSYLDRKDHLLVQTSFRGKNAFGGVVKNTVIAIVDLNGNILEVIKQD